MTTDMLLEHYRHCSLDQIQGIYVCGVCGVDFNNTRVSKPSMEPLSLIDKEWEYVHHVMKCHGVCGVMGNTNEHGRGKVCWACNKTLPFNKSIKAHAVLHVLPRVGAFKCGLRVMCCSDICGRTFPSRSQLHQHVCKVLGRKCCDSKRKILLNNFKHILKLF